MSAVIRARGLTKAYRNSRALDGVDFEIEAGRIVGLIGPNGAGKTTALKAILGLTGFSGVGPSRRRVDQDSRPLHLLRLIRMQHRHVVEAAMQGPGRLPRHQGHVGEARLHLGHHGNPQQSRKSHATRT